MSIRALFVGCNYPGETYALPDCDLDAENLAAALEPWLASAKALLNEQASRRGMVAALAKLQHDLHPDDLAIVSFSGHGTTDDLGGKPAQGLVANDGVILYEFELRQLLAQLPQAVFICDACFSGGLIRGKHRARSVPVSYCFRPQDVERPTRLASKPRVRYLACKDTETAASTGQGGAFTNALLEAFDERKEKTTFLSLAQAVRKLLPSAEYQQHPQFSYQDAAFANRALKSFNKQWNKRPQ